MPYNYTAPESEVEFRLPDAGIFFIIVAIMVIALVAV
jgi:hypothetical protein